jgi:hypothetical protein
VEQFAIRLSGEPDLIAYALQRLALTRAELDALLRKLRTQLDLGA